MTKTHTINAEGKAIGRVATEAASVLMGKTSPDFQKNKVSDVRVTIENAAKASIAPRKLGEIRAKSYSGYPGGLKLSTLAQLIEKKGVGEAFVHAVGKMIPRNRLHKERMKHLTVTD